MTRHRRRTANTCGNPTRPGVARIVLPIIRRRTLAIWFRPIRSTCHCKRPCRRSRDISRSDTKVETKLIRRDYHHCQSFVDWHRAETIISCVREKLLGLFRSEDWNQPWKISSVASKRPVLLRLVVPANARTQYDMDGIAYDTSSGSAHSPPMTMTTAATVLSTTIVVPLAEGESMKKLNGTITKRPLRKGSSRTGDEDWFHPLSIPFRNSDWYHCGCHCSASCHLGGCGHFSLSEKVIALSEKINSQSISISVDDARQQGTVQRRKLLRHPHHLPIPWANQVSSRPIRLPSSNRAILRRPRPLQ